MEKYIHFLTTTIENHEPTRYEPTQVQYVKGVTNQGNTYNLAIVFDDQKLANKIVNMLNNDLKTN